ncbi:MAG: Verru_Chthon cassette protein C [Chthoniobacteraceae bacterium]
MKSKHHFAAFTLVEVLVASGIVVIIMGVLLGMTDQTQKLVKTTSAKVEQFQEARVGYESMTRHLAQATLNTFWDYKYNNNGVPTGYQRTAELRFHSGLTKTLNPGGGPNGALQPGHCVFFQAPIGRVDNTVQLGALDHLLNTWGYFVELGTDETSLPSFLDIDAYKRKRYRLMELMEPSEKLTVYKYQGDFGPGANRKWFQSSLTSAGRPVRVLAENIVALIVLPRLSLSDEKRISTTTPPVLAPGYDYNSTVIPTASSNSNTLSAMMLNSYNQLPPVVQVIMVAIDEPSARRLEDHYSSDPYLGIGYTPDPLSGQALFKDPSALDDTANGTAGDLTRLQNLLTSRKASYRVFSSNVTIKGAKWSMHTAN